MSTRRALSLKRVSICGVYTIGLRPPTRPSARPRTAFKEAFGASVAEVTGHSAGAKLDAIVEAGVAGDHGR